MPALKALPRFLWGILQQRREEAMRLWGSDWGQGQLDLVSNQGYVLSQRLAVVAGAEGTAGRMDSGFSSHAPPAYNLWIGFSVDGKPALADHRVPPGCNGRKKNSRRC